MVEEGKEKGEEKRRGEEKGKEKGKGEATCGSNRTSHTVGRQGVTK